MMLAAVKGMVGASCCLFLFNVNVRSVQLSAKLIFLLRVLLLGNNITTEGVVGVQLLLVLTLVSPMTV